MNIIERTKIWFGISLLTLVIGAVSIGIFRLKPAIDFTGGSLLEITYPNTVKIEDLAKLAQKNNFNQVTITQTGQGSTLIRSKPVVQKDKNTFLDAVKKQAGDKSGEVVEKSFETIGPTVSSDLIRKAILSVVLASLVIIGYIAFAFRLMPDKRLSIKFGVTAVGALVHDLLFTIGIFALAAHFFKWEIDSLFITALLTVMGFSVHDTIVVFDRIRENLHRHSGRTFDEIVNMSVVQTLARSLNTSLTILITLATLLLLGGTSIQSFVFTLFIGIFVGTYSSIFIASPLVALWQRKTLARK